MLREDVRWRFGVPPINNTNFAWMQHFVHHMFPIGVAGFILANGLMSSITHNEGVIRKAKNVRSLFLVSFCTLLRSLRVYGLLHATRRQGFILGKGNLFL